MQISNPLLSQFIGTSLGRDSSVSRSSARPVTIEGQVVDDNGRKPNQSVSGSGSENEAGNGFVLDNVPGNEQQRLIAPVDASTKADDASVLADNLLNTNPTLFSPSAQFSASEYEFPYGSRKSFNGLAGNSLIIQNYLNNSPEQQNGLTGRIDFFV